MTLAEILSYVIPTLLTSITAIIGYYFKKHDAMREHERRLERKRIETAEARREKKNDAIAEGMQSLLRDSIIRLHHACMEKHGVCYYDVQNMERLYQSYHNLGGNGMATKLYKEFLALPTKSEGEK